MQQKEIEQYTGCRYTYFLKHKQLPECDHELYAQLIRIATFLNAVAKESGRSVTNSLLIKAGQTRQGLYLSCGMPPSIITPWGRWFTTVVAQDQIFGEAQEKEYWKKIKRYLILGDLVKPNICQPKNVPLYPLLGFYDTQLPEPIPRPHCEFAKIFPNPSFKDVYSLSPMHTQLQTDVFNALDRRHQGRRINLQNLCIKVIQKHGIDTSGLPEVVKEKIK